MTVDPSRDEARQARDLVGDVQRFGLLSAATIVGRYTALVDRAITEVPIDSAPRPGDGLDPQWLVDRAARLAEGYLRLLDTTAVLVASRVGEVRARPRMDRVVLPPVRHGSRAETSLWVHNPTPALSIGIEIVRTSLLSPDGATIPAEAVSISPQVVDRLHSSSSNEIRLSVDVPRDQPAGLYFGLVLISAEQEDAISVMLKVEEEEGGA